MDLVDANVILRYLLDDHPELSARAAQVVESTALYVHAEVLCEVVYVLESVYNVPRAEIVEKLTDLMEDTDVRFPSREVVRRALELYSRRKLDIVDCLLYAHNRVGGHTVHTFDEKLRKCLDGKG